MNKIENDKDKIYNYFIFLKINENNVNTIQDKRNYTLETEGSLINLEDYKYNKRIICFDELMELEKAEFEKKLNELESFNISSKIKEIKPVFLNSTKELINLINSKNEYLLIQKNILDLILPTQIHQQKAFKFNIANNILELKIGEDSLKFYNNKYILNEESYIICNGELQITKISKAILDFYIFEQNIKKSQKIEKEKVYLVSKNEIDEWKESTNYENIKNNLFKDNENDNIEFIKYEINYQLFKFYKEQKKDLKHIKFLYFASYKEFENYIKENSLVIVSQNFYNLLKEEKEIEQKIYFTSKSDTITIYIDKKEIVFPSNGNNIVYSNKESYIRILIKIYYFQEELNKDIKKAIDDNKNIKIGIIQKDWIKHFKSFFEYDNFIKNYEMIKENNYFSLSESKIDNLINIILKNHKDLVKKVHEIPNFGENKKLILYENKIDKSKILKYYNDFEIVSSDIIFPLKLLFNNSSFCFLDVKGNIIGNNKVIISIQDSKGNNYYEIGNIINNIFNAEYLLDFNKTIEFEKFLNILYKNDFEDFLDKIYNNSLNNAFPLNFDLDCLSYQINCEKIGNFIHQIKDNNNNQIKSNDLIGKFKKLLLSIYFFEKKLNYQLENSKVENTNKINLYFYKDCYLINSNFLNEFKKLLLYEFILQIIKFQKDNNPENEKKIFNNFFSTKYDCYSTIIKNNDDINNIIEKFDKLNQKDLKIKENNYFIYEDFSIINEETYLLLNELTNNNNNIIDSQKIFIIVNGGKIIFKHPNPNSRYILVYQKIKKDSFEIEIILNFINVNSFNDFFFRLNEQRIDFLLPDKLLDLIYNEKDEIIGNIHLIKNYPNDLQEKEFHYKKYLEILIKFYIENKKFMDLVESKIDEIGGINEKESFLLNKHWIDEFIYIFEYDKIYKILKSNKTILLDNNDIAIKIDQISNSISNDLKFYLNNLKEEIIYEKLSNKNFYEITNNKYTFGITNNSLDFFHKCVILPQNFLNLFKNNIIANQKQIKYLYGDNKIFIYSNIKNKQIIEIGNINEYNIFNAENIIWSNRNAQTIYDTFKIKGINYINDLKKDNKVEKYQNINLLKIETLNNKKEINILNINSISNLLKALLLIFINQYTLQNLNFSEKNNDDIDHKFECAILIDLSFLYKFEYEKIKKLIINNNNIITKLKKYSSNNVEDLLNMIFKDLEPNILNDIDNNLKLIDIYQLDSCNYFKKPEKVILLNGKNINIYNNFGIINMGILKFLTNNLNINAKFDIINYISSNGKIFIKNEIENQNIMLIGSFNDEYIFNLEYILDFESQITLGKETKEIILNWNNYIRELNNKNIYQNDYIVPIYSKDNNKKVGLCYKYNDNIKKNDYSDFQINKDLFKIVYLYVNNKTINAKLNNKKIIKLIPDKYCFINSKWLNTYKSFYNYKRIKEEINSDINIQNIINKYLNEKKDDNIEKLVYLVINHLSQNIKKLVNQENNNLNKNDIFPTIRQINFYDNSHQINQLKIYYNFEIINKEIAINFYDKNLNIEQFFINCYFIDNYIIINFLNNENDNKFISMIGEYIKFFAAKFILIYDDEEKRITHQKKVLNNLSAYLNKLQFYDNSLPIIDENFYIYGTIILLEEYNNIKNAFDYCPHIGLTNIGATCYMNATLQCFCHIEKFINFFKYNSQVLNDNKDNLSSSFKLLISKLWPNDLDFNNKYYAPYDFKNKISKMNSLFEGIAANDSKDLVNFIIMTLHEELNKAKKIDSIDNSIPIIDQRNKNQVFQNFIDDFKKRNQSIISDLFYAINCNITKCGNCQIEIYNYQIYFFLIFPLEEVRKFKNEFNNGFNQFNYFNYQNNFINSNEVNIIDCFEYNKKINYMTGQNAMYCNQCKITCNCSMCTYLVTGPEILIILLNRGKGIEFNIKIYFEENLNLSNYIEYKKGLPDVGSKIKINDGTHEYTTMTNEDGTPYEVVSKKGGWRIYYSEYNPAYVAPTYDDEGMIVDYGTTRSSRTGITNGTFTAKLYAGEYILIGNVDSGVTYEVTETDLPDGWSLDNIGYYMVDDENGTADSETGKNLVTWSSKTVTSNESHIVKVNNKIPSYDVRILKTSQDGTISLEPGRLHIIRMTHTRP